MLKFNIQKKMDGKLGRVGTLETPHGIIETPAFVTVGTKATVKALTPEQVKDLGAQVVLANTYHLYLQPGDEILKKAGGLHKFMNWSGPTMTDSGGFQAFSLGAAFGDNVSKIASGESVVSHCGSENGGTDSSCALAKIDEDGVVFRSHIDGSEHRFTPEKSIQIQHNIGADMIFAFDECTSPQASYEYQKEAMGRTHRWAKRSLDEHKKLNTDRKISLLGIVQGGRFEDLRKESAKVISEMDFDGFGIGGSFSKEDMYTAVGWVNEILPEDKPRHLLGIGEPADLFGGIENGIDLFDCVAPTRMGRNGTLHTSGGKINILNAKFKDDFSPIEEGCGCYACQNYTKAYIAHLFRAKEMQAGTLASIHNLYFIINLVKKIRQSILNENFEEFKAEFLERYYGNSL
ncbi:tRNA guanosine(34) transglycosylase Tgt [Candidatus Campbellbacteria bacterium RIFOXYC2_FULL_35_25]|uniref:Queuine tRNA-ribosyltransferase n=1 Tax=Candidatus Campbellbacteria bacterium RIFOXYC2_FULL_35_25 TaxID=1797582 RepID=A0A1F5EI10_9BACT|nr:MAG: tRNA guanosine(34) transglycosylase Tgt [Candidatus Campbellbacteria bacterium RIFOXYC2_FULL_35_25]